MSGNEDGKAVAEAASDQDFPDYIEFFVNSLAVDPNPYKPISPEFTPVSALVVRVPFPAEMVIEQDVYDGDGLIVIDLDGFKLITKILLTAVREAHNEYQDQQAR